MKVEVVKKDDELKSVAYGDIIYRKMCNDFYVISIDVHGKMMLASLSGSTAMNTNAQSIINSVNSHDYIYYKKDEYKIQLRPL